MLVNEFICRDQRLLKCENKADEAIKNDISELTAIETEAFKKSLLLKEVEEGNKINASFERPEVILNDLKIGLNGNEAQQEQAKCENKKKYAHFCVTQKILK